MVDENVAGCGNAEEVAENDGETVKRIAEDVAGEVGRVVVGVEVVAGES